MKNVLLISNLDAIRRVDKATAILAYASSHDWNVSVINATEGVRPGELVRTLRPDGIIIEGVHTPEESDLRTFERIPAVFLDSGYRKARYAVASDSVAVANLAMNELAKSHPASFLFVTDAPDCHWSREREQVARERSAAMGLPFAVATGNFTDALLALPRPVGVFVVHDNVALAVYAAAKAARLGIPTQVRIVSVDNNPAYAGNLKPSLTSIEQNSYQAGSAAAELLGRLLQRQPVTNTHIHIQPSGIVRRASSANTSTNLGIREALFAIREHACDGLSVTDVSRVMDMSRRAAEIAFLRETGSTIYESILARRFEEVERLLHAPNVALCTIANRCGWRSPSHLARAFRRRYGVTMTVWRARLDES